MVRDPYNFEDLWLGNALGSSKKMKKIESCGWVMGPGTPFNLTKTS